MTDKEIRSAHNYRDSRFGPPLARCDQCDFYSATPHPYRVGIVFHNCAKFVSAGYTQPVRPDYTCDSFKPST